MNFEALRDFLAITAHGSLAAASAATGVPRSTLSKRLQNLEASFGVRLLERNTRSLRLTEEGEILRDRAAALLQDADELERFIRTRVDAPAGRIRVAVPTLFGNLAMGPIASEYRGRWPLSSIDVTITERRVDLIEEGYDCAVVVGELDDTDLICRKLAQSSSVLVAEPELASSLVGGLPGAIHGLPTIGYLGGGTTETWSLKSDGQRIDLEHTPALTFSTVQATMSAAIAGGGIAMVPMIVAAPEIRKGTLVHVWPEWSGEDHPIFVVYPSRRLMSARLRTFIDHLEVSMKRMNNGQP